VFDPEVAEGARDLAAAVDGHGVLVRDLEAFDGTPIVDVKPVLRGEADRR
jgi:tRNA (Thr-GGU) A37 N-methylase